VKFKSLFPENIPKNRNILFLKKFLPRIKTKKVNKKSKLLKENFPVSPGLFFAKNLVEYY